MSHPDWRQRALGGLWVLEAACGALLVLSSGIAYSAPPDAGSPVEHTEEAEPSATDVDRVAQATLWLAGGPDKRCRATLVAPRLLATAAGCVAPLPPSEDRVCDATTGLFFDKGAGGSIGSPVAPGDLTVYSKDPMTPEAVELAKGAALSLPARTLIGCINHLAFVYLDREVKAHRPLPISLRTPLQVGDTLLGATPARFVKLLSIGRTPVPQARRAAAHPGFLDLDLHACAGPVGAPLVDPETLELLAILVDPVDDCKRGNHVGHAVQLSHLASFIRETHRGYDLSPPPLPEQAGRPFDSCSARSPSLRSGTSRGAAFGMLLAIALGRRWLRRKGRRTG